MRKFEDKTAFSKPAVNIQILMFNGSLKYLHEIEIGDRLMGDDSTPRTVLKKIMAYSEIYELWQLYGDSIYTHGGIILCLKSSKSPQVIDLIDKRSISVRWVEEQGVSASKNFSYRSCEKDTSEKAAREYAETLPKKGSFVDVAIPNYIQYNASWKKLHKSYKVAIEYPHLEVMLDPYILGAWLGDGTSRLPEITSIDPEILQAFSSAFPDLIVKCIGNTKIRYSVTTGTNFGGKKRNRFLNALKDLDLLENKHIPDCYLFNDRTTRLRVLAGLIDTDGHLENGCFEIVQKNVRIAENIVTLARSLGFRVTIRAKEISFTYKGEKKEGIHQRMIISGHINEVPVLLPRKMPQPRKQIKDPLVYGSEIRLLGKHPITVLEIDGNRRVVLKDYTVVKFATNVTEKDGIVSFTFN